MHLSSLDKMKHFADRYLVDQRAVDLKILDLGSSAIGGSYKAFFDKDPWRYTGVDITPGENVDLVLSDPYNWLEIDSDAIDVLVSGQTFEHIEYFWRTMLEISRVLKPGGLCCIIAPSRGPEHKYPVDCWRFYPDGFKALARYAGLEPLQVYTHWEDEGYADGSDEWGDTVLVARKPVPEASRAEQIHIYKRDADTEGKDALSKLLPRIKPDSTLLELGPATGYATAVFKEELGCRVDCVEISEEMAAACKPFCDRMLVADLDEIDLADHFEPDHYDYIVLADVLEHLKSDARTLRSCHRLLKEGGHCLLSVPNIAHAAVVGRLLKGRFDYTDEGLLDRTHLRFYTLESITALLEACGFSIVEVDPLIKLPEDTEMGDSLVDLPHAVQKLIYEREHALCYQFVVVCAKNGNADQRRVHGRKRSPVDLRKAFTTSLNDRIAELSDLCLERQQQIAALTDRLAMEGEALAEAQKIAWERQEQLTTVERILDQRQETVALLQAELTQLKSTPWYKVYRKLKQILTMAKPS